MSNRLVTTWNSAIASRLNFGWPKPEPATCCVISWPSRFSWNCAIAHARRGVDGVGGDALDLHRQLHPVAALQRQLLHLAAIDVAGDLRRADVDQRRLAGDRQRLRQRRHLHRERQRPVLADQQLDFRNQHGRKSGQLGLHLVAAGGETAQAGTRRARRTPSSWTRPVSIIVAVMVAPGNAALVPSTTAADQGRVLRERRRGEEQDARNRTEARPTGTRIAHSSSAAALCGGGQM